MTSKSSDWYSHRGVFKSVDGGQSFFALPNRLSFVVALAVDPFDSLNIIAGINSGPSSPIPLGYFVRSIDGGQVWEGVPSNGNFAPVNDVVFNSSDRGIGYGVRTINLLEPGPLPGEAVWKTTDSGASWYAVGIPDKVLNGFCVIPDPMSSSTLYAGVSDGLYKSDDGGTTWIPLGLEQAVLSLAVCPDSNNILFASTPEINERQIYERGKGQNLPQRVLVPGSIATGSSPTSLTFTDADATVWAFDCTGEIIPEGSSFQTVPIQGVESSPASGSRLLRSRNGGLEWETLNLSDIFITGIIVNPVHPQTVYASGYNDGEKLNRLKVFRSTDRGDTWDIILDPDPESGLHVLENFHNGFVLNPQDGSTLLAGTMTGSYLSRDGGETFDLTGVPLSTYRTASSTAASGRIMASSSTPMFGGVLAEGFVYTRDAADTVWRKVFDEKWPAASVMYNALTTGELAVSALGYGIQRSTDDGETWQDISHPGRLNVSDFLFDPLDHQSIFTVHADIGTFPPGIPEIRKSTDSGSNWELIWQAEDQIACFTVDPVDNRLFYTGLYPTTLKKSTDGGVSWLTIDYFDDKLVRAVCVNPGDPDEILAGTYQDGLHCSTDAGVSWTRADFPDSVTVSCITHGSLAEPLIFAGTEGEGVWFSRSSGDTFNPVNDGLASRFIYWLTTDTIDRDIIFAATACGIYRMNMAALDIGSVRKKVSGSALPHGISLDQNYPNPFNPATSISFDLSGDVGTKQPVRLTVYDLRGRRVKTLVDEDLDPGTHRVVWDGKNEQGQQVSSGIYLYTLKSGVNTVTRKMLAIE